MRITKNRSVRVLEDIRDTLQGVVNEGRVEVVGDFSLSPNPEENPVLSHGLGPDGTPSPLRLDDEGYLMVDVRNSEILVALSAEEDSVEVYGRDYEAGTVRSVAVDGMGRLITRPATRIEEAFNDVVNVQEIVTNPVDVRAYKTATIYVFNDEDVPVNITIETSPDGAVFTPIRTFQIPPHRADYAVLAGEYHPFIRFRLVADSAPSSGTVKLVVAKAA